MSEHLIQKTYFEWLKKKNPKVYSLAFAIPNGGQRHVVVASKLKAEGVKAGVPDIFIAVPRKGFHGLFMEAKTEKGKPTKSQLEWMDRLAGQGYMVALCKGLDALIDTTESYFEEKVFHYL